MDFATASRPPLGRVIAGLRREGVDLLQGAYLGEEMVLRRRGKDVVVAARGGGVGEGKGGGRTAEAEGAETRGLIARALRRYGWVGGGGQGGASGGGYGVVWLCCGARPPYKYVCRRNLFYHPHASRT